MKTPSLTFETFVAALAVVGASASMGCSRNDRASAEPGAASPAAAAPGATGAAAQASATPLQAPPANAKGSEASEPAASRAAVTATAVPPAPPPMAGGAAPKPARADADDQPAKPKIRGGDGTKPKSPVRVAPTASASCGAGTCSDDMKKGN